MSNAHKPNGREKLLIAARAAVALRSVDNYFNGVALRANTVAHIRRALEELGLERFALAPISLPKPSSPPPAA